MSDQTPRPSSKMTILQRFTIWLFSSELLLVRILSAVTNKELVRNGLFQRHFSFTLWAASDRGESVTGYIWVSSQFSYLSLTDTANHMGGEGLNVRHLWHKIWLMVDAYWEPSFFPLNNMTYLLQRDQLNGQLVPKISSVKYETGNSWKAFLKCLVQTKVRVITMVW